MDDRLILKKIVGAASDVKALGLISIDVQGNSSIADFIVVCHGTSGSHAQGISDRIHMILKNEDTILPLGIEGYSEGEWILMDYNSVIVHIFQDEIKDLYNLEELYKEVTNEVVRYP